MLRLILLFLMFHSPIFALDKVSLQLQWKHQFQFAGYYVAKEKGFYKDIGLDVELKEFDSGIDIVDDVSKGKTTFATSYPTVILEKFNGKDIVLLSAIFQQSPHVLISLKSSGIRSIQDFKDKKIMIEKDALKTTTIMSMLESNHISYDDMIKIKHTFNIEDLIDAKADIYAAYISNEIYKLDKLGLEYTIWNPSDYGFDFYNDLLYTSSKMLQTNPKMVENFRKASLKGWEYAFANIDETVDLILEKYNTQNKTKEALVYEAKTLKKLAYDNTKELGNIDKNKIQRIYDIYNLMGLVKNKIELDELIYKPINKDNFLSKKEIEFIDNNKEIKVCIHSDNPPFMIKEKNSYTGLSLDFLDLISEKTDLNFKILDSKSMEKHFKMMEDGVCDISPLVLTKPNLHDVLIPTKPYISDNLVLVTEIHTPYISDVTTLINQKIIVQKGAKNLILYIKSLYPNLNLIEVANFDMKKIIDGEFYGYIGPSYQISYQITESYFYELKIMAKIGDKKVNGSMGVTIREPILLSIFNKAIDDISQNEKNKIINNWLDIKIEQHIDYTMIFKIITVFLIIIFIIFIAYIKQKRLKKDIELEKNKFQNIFDNSTDGVLILTNKIFTDCNEAIVKMLKYKTKNDILNLTPSQLSPTLQPDNQNSLEKSQKMMKIAIEKGSHNFEWIHLKADGTHILIDITLTDISKYGDEIIHVLWRDITEKKRLEDEIIEINKNLEVRVANEVLKNKEQQFVMFQQSRLAQMGEMISMIAHQWRQPLNTLSIMNQSIVLKYEMGIIDDKVISVFNTNSQRQIVQMSDTIDDFRNFFKPEKEKKHFDIIESVEHAISIISSALKQESIELRFSFDKECYVHGYPNEIGQGIINIINNAKDALVNNKIKNRYIDINLTKNKTDVRLTISDNAGGISENIIDKIFDPYFSTKMQSNGTGLGLYMTKAIIQDHMNGKVSVFNNDDGAMFKIELQREIK